MHFSKPAGSQDFCSGTVNTVYGMDCRYPVSETSTIFSFSASSKPALGPIHPPIQGILEAVSAGLKRQRHEAAHSSPSSVYIQNSGAIPSIPYASSWCGAQLIKHRNNFTAYYVQTGTRACPVSYIIILRDLYSWLMCQIVKIISYILPSFKVSRYAGLSHSTTLPSQCDAQPF
jgi:hypothetical protein